MNFNQIRFFLAVAETLNFTSAAESCAVSQPALSKAIRNLEDSLGAELFSRNTQHVELTEFGRTMRVHFERIEENRRRALDAAKLATKAATEPLNVGVMCTIGPRRFSGFLETLRQTDPQIEVTLHDVTPSVIPPLLLSGSLDCVFCAREAKHDQRFETLDLFNEHMFVAFADGHRFAEMDSVALEEIAKEPYLDRLHCEFRDEFLDFTKGSGLELDVVLRSERDDWVLELLRQGIGVSVIPANSIILNDVLHRPICDLTGHRCLELVTTKNEDMTPALRTFRALATAYDWH
jgi:DNA-binding transcriptional LysR family regulator